jgi:hypothetical protein
MDGRADGPTWSEREVVRTAIYLWRHCRYTSLTRLKELNHAELYLWDTEEELSGISLGRLP